ncbi:alpha/beta hydrolase [Sporosarcina sp. ACRSL]|uniref:alpha/beta fold hydrolase n=1 Tax=Sporosarcina sp. ACRSL TaxID=2918215 RepID=UPI001EF74167|nr:alpha/beta hydrolase [Sporosarcina sp. ACRSL]MCG7342596.1 alpha/beta hydrolase [Sporosarcina sp. ACRSL]
MILHTNVYGNGEPVIFLHTGLQTGETDFVYQRNKLQESYKVILPDLRGHGKSKIEEFEIQSYFEDAANDLHKTMLHLNINQAHVVGCSLGALVGLLFAKRFPSFVTSLTLSGIIPQKPSNWNKLRQSDIAMQNGILENVDAIQYFNSIHQSDWQSFLRKTIEQDWYLFDETGNIEELRCRTLFIVGEEKEHEVLGVTIYPKQNQQVHIAVVPFAGHLVHNEQPELYTKILERFLNERRYFH